MVVVPHGSKLTPQFRYWAHLCCSYREVSPKSEWIQMSSLLSASPLLPSQRTLHKAKNSSSHTVCLLSPDISLICSKDVSYHVISLKEDFFKKNFLLHIQKKTIIYVLRP